jgi:hypothetical protein
VASDRSVDIANGVPRSSSKTLVPLSYSVPMLSLPKSNIWALPSKPLEPSLVLKQGVSICATACISIQYGVVDTVIVLALEASLTHSTREKRE